MPRAALRWVHDRSLTLVMLGLFGVFTGGQVLTGWYEFNDELAAHGRAALSLGGYLATGHLWEAIFENWESEFLQMAAFVTFTTCLYQKGSPESRAGRRRARSIATLVTSPNCPVVPWPVRRGGWVLFS